MAKIPTQPQAPDRDARKPQRNRQLKFWCPSCGWVGRASRKCIDAGLPTCHCGAAMAEPQGVPDGDDD